MLGSGRNDWPYYHRMASSRASLGQPLHNRRPHGPDNDFALDIFVLREGGPGLARRLQVRVSLYLTDALTSVSRGTIVVCRVQLRLQL